LHLGYRLNRDILELKILISVKPKRSLLASLSLMGTDEAATAGELYMINL
jgi:hypothetical protein